MKCGEITHRQKLQDQLLEMNPGAGEAIERMVCFLVQAWPSVL